MKTYLVECYVPRTRSTEFAEMAARLSARLSGDRPARQDARYLRSTYVPEDELCLHLFEAESADAVRDASLLAHLPFDRIVEVQENGR